ncbi:DUF6541 family protein [Gordonia sp. NPDC003424]
MLLGAWISLVTALVLIVPGALVGRLTTLPWPVAIAAGPPITLAIVSWFTVTYSAIGIGWNVLTAAIAVAISLLVAWGYSALLKTRRLRVLTPERDDDDPPLDRRGVVWLVAGAALGGVIIVITCIRPLVKTAFAGLNNIPQVWDSLWHASSLRWIQETGIGSALRMGELMNYDTHGFNYYPNTWHALGALVISITGAEPVEIYNAYSPAVLAVTVPFGVASLAYWMARHRFDTRRSALLAAPAAAVAALFPSLPYVEIELTSVPNAVGVSIAPVAAILIVTAVRDRRRVVPAALALSGVTATHPSGLILAGVIIAVWWLTEGLWRPAYGRLRDLGTLVVTGVLTLILIAPVIYGTIRVSDTNTLPFFDFREETVGVLDGLAQAAFNGTVPLDEHFPIWILIVLTVIGLGVLLWMRCWAGVVTWLVFVLVTANSVVALGALSYPLGAIGGYFYNSPHRLTFVVAMFSAAAAGIALGAIALAVAQLFSRRASSDSPRGVGWVVPAAFAVLLVVIAAAGVWKYPANAQLASKERGGKFIGPDDLAAYHWLARQPGAHDALILNNLDQGTGWIYPVTGLTPMFPFYRANDFSQRQRDLFWGVSQIGSDAYIDDIVRDMDVHWVIDSPPSYWPFQNGVPDPKNGVQGDPFLALREHGAPGLTREFQQGNVTVYRVNGSVYPPG